MGRGGIRSAFETGRGSIMVRARAEVETGDRDRIIIHELPYQVNKAQLLERIGEWCAKKQSKASAISAMKATGQACASSSISNVMRRGM